MHNLLMCWAYILKFIIIYNNNDEYNSLFFLIYLLIFILYEKKLKLYSIFNDTMKGKIVNSFFFFLTVIKTAVI